MVETQMPTNRVILYCCNEWNYFLLHRLPPVQAIIEKGWHATVCAGDEKPRGYLSDFDLVELNIERHRFTPLADALAALKIVRLARSINAEVVHAITIKPILYTMVGFGLKSLFLRSSKVPRVILTFPGLGRVFEDTDIVSQVRRKLIVGTMRFFARHLDCHATFENESDRDYFISLGIFRPEQTRVTFGAGIKAKLFKPATEKRNGPLHFLFASRLIHSKGVEDFIEAARQRRHQGSDAKFTIAGLLDPNNPDAFPAYKLEESQAEGLVNLAGAVPGDAMPDLLRSVDVVCLPTRLREGFPRVLIEAAASGVALLASRQPSVEQIIENGVNGWMTEPSSPNELARKMSEMEDDPDRTRQMGEASLTLARSSPISEEDVNAVFLQLYLS